MGLSVWGIPFPPRPSSYRRQSSWERVSEYESFERSLEPPPLATAASSREMLAWASACSYEAVGVMLLLPSDDTAELSRGVARKLAGVGVGRSADVDGTCSRAVRSVSRISSKPGLSAGSLSWLVEKFGGMRWLGSEGKWI